MKYIILQSWLDVFSLEVIQKIFHKLVKLDKSSYTLYRKQFPGSAGFYAFEYPSHLTDIEAQLIVDELNTKIKDMKIIDLCILINKF